MPVSVPVLVLALLVGTLVGIITAGRSRARHLHRAVWLLVVVLLPLIGPVLWFCDRQESASRAERDAG